MSGSNSFEQRKKEVLQNLKLGINDNSPRGHVDVPILELVNFINDHQDYYTTSSCSGRISIFLDDYHTKGVHWILVKHCLVHTTDIQTAINERIPSLSSTSIITMKCEPMILHIECHNLESARGLHQIAMESGFRESGITLGQKRTMIAIRTTSNSLELPLVMGLKVLFDDVSLDLLTQEANKRLLQNFYRIDKLLHTLKATWSWPRFQYLPSISRSYDVHRWAHTIIPYDDKHGNDHQHAIAAIGGYGYETNSSKSSRSLDVLLLGSDAKFMPLPMIECMHSCSMRFRLKNDVNYVILSGGRTSPGNPLPCVQAIYSHSLQAIIPTIQSGDIPAPRWGHTLSSIQHHVHVCMMLVGGRDEMHVYDDCYLLTCSLAEDNSMISCHWEKLSIMITPMFFHAACVIPSYYAYDEKETAVIIHGGLSSISETITTSNHAYVIYPHRMMIHSFISSSISLPRRFGHSMTYIGNRSLMLVGGSSYDDDNTSSYIIDLGINTESSLLSAIKIMSLESMMISSSSSSSEASSDATMMPCTRCRCHHQTCYDKIQQRIYIIGGGAMCLGFGAHYCESTVLGINMGHHISSYITSSTVIHDHNIKASSSSTETLPSLSTPAIIVHKSLVKAMKTYLEQSSMLDKSRRISTAIEPDDPSMIMIIDLINLTMDHMKAIDIDAMHMLYDGAMAIPITSTCYDHLSFSSSSSSSRQLIHDLHAIIYDKNSSSGVVTCHLYTQAQHHAPVSKTIVANHSRQAHEYLEHVISQHHLPSSATRSLPKKYECIGDVLMIPEDAMVDESWSAVLSNATTSASIWQGLCGIFHTTRVARKARIDIGPKRESHVILLYPSPLSHPPSLDNMIDDSTPVHQAPGWVEITENRITYGFDITKVMFCSGNVTERMRASHLSVQGQTIVDLYCGIGYYTLPYLVHGQAKVVHACEWNINSVRALEYNLQKMKVSDRCHVYHGDNRITIAEHVELHHIADRVSLGLLPSSTAGWPLAAKVLKREGGTIHVHENVIEAEINTWIITCCDEFQRLFEAEHSTSSYRYNVRCIHLEQVKSYAPRVMHVVADLLIQLIPS